VNLCERIGRLEFEFNVEKDQRKLVRIVRPFPSTFKVFNYEATGLQRNNEAKRREMSLRNCRCRILLTLRVRKSTE